MAFQYTDDDPIDCTVEPDITKLKGKSVIITGGSSGLGAGYAKAFILAGAFVTNADINPNADLEGEKNYQFCECDVTSWEDQLAAFKAAIANSPEKSLDIVVANVGIGGADPLFTLEETDEPTKPSLRIININFIGVVYTSKLAMHYFNKQDASRDKSLILTSSLAGYVDMVGATQYQSSKFAVRGLMCNLRRAGRMRVNLLAPWYIRTSIMSDAIAKVIDDALTKIGSNWATIDDAVRACLRLAADPLVQGISSSFFQDFY
ncbi:short chain dehydrogenase reductase [Xylogone sp. PMI_703]|nr:short chain dehydrogenase reductase [Xylogone sp. PMI_703]